MSGIEEWRSIRATADGRAVEIVDQTRLPQALVWRRLVSLAEVVEAIRTMRVRGAPLIGAAAAYGMALAMQDDPTDTGLSRATEALAGARPTAVNLRAALGRTACALREVPPSGRAEAAWTAATTWCDEDIAINRAIGAHGVPLLRHLAARGERPVQVLTHCNAGRLATVGWGTALAPVYRAHLDGVPVHVWVSETRPRLQGGLTAWELGEAGVPHTVVVDNAAGHLLLRGAVDICLVGTDRTTSGGDVCNKIGTYLKALAAREAGVPFYAAVPGPSIDWEVRDPADIPIEERDEAEVTDVTGTTGTTGTPGTVRVMPPGVSVYNPGFDVTPARLVSGLITERGVCPASAEGLAALYPERVG